VTIGKSKERKERITKARMLTLREIISDGLIESDSRTLLRKPGFVFGDAIEEDDRILYDGDYKWLRQIGDRRFFLPNIERCILYPIFSICRFIARWSGIFPVCLWRVSQQIRCQRRIPCWP